jgi:hypothetical protein
MRLLNANTFELREFHDPVPLYAILSHTWGNPDDEISFQDIRDLSRARRKQAFTKIEGCARVALLNALEWIWVDTCSIDKSSSAELSEAIISMFRWYREAVLCFVVLEGTGEECEHQDLAAARWFTRGWTLQELLAPTRLEFYSASWIFLGTRESLKNHITRATGIPENIFCGHVEFSNIPAGHIWSWTNRRQTTRPEDQAYCLFGIFDVSIPVLYGEGKDRAFGRLKEEIEKRRQIVSALPITEDDLEHRNNVDIDEGAQKMLLSNEDKEKLWESLRFDDIDARQLTIQKAYTKTCNWLLETPEYCNWLNALKLEEHKGFLWIKGKPGAGKSTIMKFAYINARESMPNRIIISFFFNARGAGDLEKSTVGMYRSLLFQLLGRIPRLQTIFDTLESTLIEDHHSHKWSIESLKELFEQAIQSLQDNAVICYIDALDECDEHQVRDMTSFFEQLGELAVGGGTQFWVCFSSRHYPQITIRYGESLVLEGQLGHSKDITTYLSRELRVGHNHEASEIREELQEKAMGVFIWIVLVVRILNIEYSRGRIQALRKRLHDIPNDLHRLFRDMLTRDQQHANELLLCVQWLLFAADSLTPQDLYFAILAGCEPEYLSIWDKTSITLETMGRRILDASKGILEITTVGPSRVQFIHESVRDFFLKENGLSTLWPELNHMTLRGQSHDRLKKCCLSYFNFARYSESTLLTPPSEYSFDQNYERRRIQNDYPFLKYATFYILRHADSAQAAGVDQSQFLQVFPQFRRTWIYINNLFADHNRLQHGHKFSLLSILTEYGMSNLIRIHPARSEYLNFAFGWQNSSITARDDVESKASPKYSGSRNQHKNSIYVAANEGDDSLLASLLTAENPKPNLMDSFGNTLLCYASFNKCYKSMKILLDSGCDINMPSRWFGTAIQAASFKGHYEVVKFLLNQGAEFNRIVPINKSPENVNWTADLESLDPPPCIRPTFGYERIIQLLHSDGAGGKGGNAMFSAAIQGHENIVDLLLKERTYSNEQERTL